MSGNRGSWEAEHPHQFPIELKGWQLTRSIVLATVQPAGDMVFCDEGAGKYSVHFALIEDAKKYYNVMRLAQMGHTDPFIEPEQ